MKRAKLRKQRHRVVQRDTHTRRLRKLLRYTDIRELLVAVWAIRAVGLGQADSARRFMNFPEYLIDAKIGSEHFIAPWTLETLTNEGLFHPNFDRAGRKRDPANFNNFATLYNSMQGLENAESLMDIPDGKISRALPRLGWRQFEWQETFFRDRKIYRAWRLYTVPEAAAYFEEKRGIGPNRATAIGFLLFTKLLSNPEITAKEEPTGWGITKEETETVLSFISRPLAISKNRAKQLRSKRGEVAYKPSVLRETPMVSLWSSGAKRYFCPLPDLCIQRLTDGLYQDLVENQLVMQKVASEFENYSYDILSHYAHGHYDVLREVEYGRKGQKVLTPDLRLTEYNTSLKVIIECKRRLLPYKIASSVDPTQHFPELYDDFVKGVQQIWRYVSKVRRNIADKNWKLDDKAVGLVLTLHPWMLMSGEAVSWIKGKARDTLKPEWQVAAVDMIPVSFSHTDDIEVSLTRLPIKQLQSALLRHAEEDRVGYSFRHVAEEFYYDSVEIAPFDYSRKTGELVAWWAEMRASMAVAASRAS